MNESNLINYYNKFNEDKRLNTKHGNIEFITAINYINKYIKKGDKILDIGAGTGKYSIYFYNQGYDVTALELVKHNLRVLEKNEPNIKAYHGNALNLKFNDSSFDIVLLFGPMYHLISFEDKLKAINEAKRVLKPNGLIFISYCMNDYAVITHGFIENNINQSIKDNLLDNNYKITPKNTDLYSFVRIEDINRLNKLTKLKRKKILNQDGPTEYLKKIINKMDNETYNNYIKYHLKTCEKKELLGAGRHILDIVSKVE